MSLNLNIIFIVTIYYKLFIFCVCVFFLDAFTFKLKGCILTISFLDCNGALIPYSYESWKDETTEGKERNRGSRTNSRMSPLLNAQTSNTTGEGCDDRQFVILASEKQARVVALPSQNCVYRQQLSETHAVIKAEITSIKGNFFLLIDYILKYNLNLI